MKRLGLLLLALLAAPRPAGAASVVAVGDEAAIFGIGGMILDGVRPGAGGAAREYEQRSFWLNMRAGSAYSTNETELDSHVGFQVDLRLGITPRESAPLRAEIVPLEAALGLGLAVRAFTWNAPFHGMIAFHLGGEAGLGGAYWWSDTPRLTFLGGARLCIETASKGRAEIHWALAPFTATGSPGDLDVDHLEHRLSLTAGVDGVGVGVRLLFGREHTRIGEAGPREGSWSRSLGIFLELRS